MAYISLDISIIEVIMQRLIEKHLSEWFTDKDRKILLLRGARQVGKTFSVREFGRRFKKFVEINFEARPDIARFFVEHRTPGPLLEKISIITGTTITDGDTLLFFDEIQACPDALRSLRFFHEERPGLHLIAAGSLLEFALEEIPSFGVGRIESLFMYPLSFEEFLRAEGRGALADAVRSASPARPLDRTFHDLLLDRLRIFLIVGGMPQAVSRYLSAGDLAKVHRLHDALIASYLDDFAKYRKKIPTTRLREVFRSIVEQAGRKFKYAAIGPETTAAYRQAIELLIQAGIAYPIYHTAARGLPLGGQIDPKRFKIAFFDCGLFQRLAGLDAAPFIVLPYDELINKGAVAELHVAQELVKNQSPHTHPALYYWHREARSSNAEVDFVVPSARGFVPVEVKAGLRGAMRSMRLFLSERGMKTGVRVTSEPFGTVDDILIVPLYAAGRVSAVAGIAPPTPPAKE
jgi:predicted AAA+ superfamily ATPase